MPIDASLEGKSPLATLTGTTNAGTWTLLTVPVWATYVSGINNLDEDLSIRVPATTEAAAYAAGDAQQIIPPGGPWSLPLQSFDGPKGAFKTLSVHTPTSQTLHFTVGS